jgi:hypothetical protein
LRKSKDGNVLWREGKKNNQVIKTHTVSNGGCSVLIRKMASKRAKQKRKQDKRLYTYIAKKR